MKQVERLLLPFFALMVTLLLAPVGSEIYRSFAYDDSPPFSVERLVVVNDTSRPGGTIEYIMDYTKRMDCYPPEGSGEAFSVLTKIHKAGAVDLSNYEYTLHRTAIRPPGVNKNKLQTIVLPLDIPPGNYTYTLSGVYNCKKASRDKLLFNGPSFEIKIE